MHRRSALVLLALAATACSPSAREGDSAPRAGAEPAAAPAAEAPPAATQQPASPRDTVRGRIGGADLLVDYGRPYMRGRTIMGGLVPYGRVWRTGANEATHLVTSADLRIGGVAVPAGTYTLYTLPGESEWALIVNRQTGQWGTVYDEGRDLARIPMRIRRLDAPVDQFTLSIEPRGEGEGVLALEWETTRAEVSVAAAGR
jgi:hypothetical protein